MNENAWANPVRQGLGGRREFYMRTGMEIGAGMLGLDDDLRDHLVLRLN